MSRCSHAPPLTHFKAVLAAWLLLGALPALAADIPVDGTTCSLANAITAANTDAPTAGCAAGAGADTIILNADVTLNVVSLLSTLQRGAFSALPDITSQITIRAGSASVIRRNPGYTCTNDTVNPVFRFFNVLAGSLVLEDLALEDICLAGPSADGALAFVNVATSLTLEGVTVSNATAVTTSSIQGGLIYAQGEVAIIDTLIDTFSVEASLSLQGGVLYSSSGSPNAVMLQGTTLRGVQVQAEQSVQGVGIYNFNGTVALSNVLMETSGGSNPESMQGGLVYVFGGPVSIEQTAVSGWNWTTTNSLSGGVIYAGFGSRLLVLDLEISDSTLSGGGIDGGGMFVASSIAEISGLQIRNLTALSDALCFGGGIAATSSNLLTMSDFIVEGVECRGTVAQGAGLSFVGVDAASLRDCVLRDNDAVFGVNNDFSDAGRGGGVYSSASALSLERCAIIGNSVTPASATSAGPAEGGGVWTTSMERFANLTIADNVVQAGSGELAESDGDDAVGAGIALIQPAATNSFLAASTFSGNRATAGEGASTASDGTAFGAGLYLGAGQVVQVENNLLAGNVVVTPAGVESPGNCHDAGGTFQSFGYNLAVVTGSCAFTGSGDIIGIDPLLYPLGDYGCALPLPDGSCPMTFAIDQTSAATDSGYCGFSALNTDARSFLRPQDVGGQSNAIDGCDMGSYEAFDTDFDGITDLPDICPLDFDPGQEDADADTSGDACDLCPGFDDRVDSDTDGSPDGCDLCFGDDQTGNADGDSHCTDADCNDGDPGAQVIDLCGVCGGDNSTCGIFIDGFETGDTSLWN